MSKEHLDRALVAQGLVATRNQAATYIKLGQVRVNGAIVSKPELLVRSDDELKLTASEQYVSRAALKLASVATVLGLDFAHKTVLDVGSSTGGFTDYALRHGARKVIAVEVGTDQLHTSLRSDPRIELHEKTDIRHFQTAEKPDIVLADVSFISLQAILPSVAKLSSTKTRIVAMVKPQFEATSPLKHKGVIKNDTLRREILKDFELWTREHFLILDKADSAIAGVRGNKERFYLLQRLV